MAFTPRAAGDGCVKFWDMRRLAAPLHALAPGGAAGSHLLGSATVPRRAGDLKDHGVTAMVLSPAGDRLLVSSHSNTHYVYRTSALDRPPIAGAGKQLAIHSAELVRYTGR